MFTGRFHHYRVDSRSNRFFYDGLLIKDIHANLFLKWAVNRFHEVKKILLMRHPFAVALSKEKLKHWEWMTDPKDFLEQKDLYTDYLLPYESEIESTSSYFEKQVMIWAIIHYVPLKQLTEKDVLPVFYESLVEHPKRELERIFSFVFGQDFGRSIPPEAHAGIKKPSRTSRKDSAIIAGKDLLSGWRTELSKSQILKGVEILGLFGLDRIYNDDPVPDRKALEYFLKA